MEILEHDDSSQNLASLGKNMFQNDMSAASMSYPSKSKHYKPFLIFVATIFWCLEGRKGKNSNSIYIYIYSYIFICHEFNMYPLIYAGIYLILKTTIESYACLHVNTSLGVQWVICYQVSVYMITFSWMSLQVCHCRSVFSVVEKHDEFDFNEPDCE